MRSEARLESAVFQLTPTRTRCELVITANGKTEKLASGLLNPFLAHLKTAQDQIAKGGYSITLEPDPTTDAFWFTKGTVERFVRFVSTPEILERVATIESEIVQIEDAINIQGNESLSLGTVEDHQTKPPGLIEGSKLAADADGDKAIVLYKPGSQTNPADRNGSAAQEENSKVQLLKVLETRKVVLQKEQAMAFARATAAGFEMDHMTHLIMFADGFGASRLKEACLKFMDLWRIKHETGQWIEVEAAEAIPAGFSPFNTSGIVLAGDATKPREFGESSPASGSDLGAESNGNGATTERHHEKPQAPPGSHEYFQGQYHQPAYPPWAMHPPSGPPVYQPYPIQGMPYYQNYPGSVPFYQPPYAHSEDPRSNPHRRIGRRRHSLNNDEDSESWDDDEDQNLSEPELGVSHGRKSQKRAGRSGKKKPGVVVIKNLNYVTSKKNDKSGEESQSNSRSETEDETEDSHSDTAQRKHKKSSRSSKKNEAHKKSRETSSAYDGDEMMVRGNDGDSGNWQAFQSFLLRAEEKASSAADGDMFSGEKKAAIKRRQNLSEPEPILTPERDSGYSHEDRINEFDSISRKGIRARKMSANDELLTSNDGRNLSGSHLDAQFLEVESGGGGYRPASTDDFMIYGQEKQTSSKTSLDPLAEHGYEHSVGYLEKKPYVATDESFIVPLRSGSEDQLETNNRTIDMDSELPTSLQIKEDYSTQNQLSYEPDDLTMMPERAFESEYIGYDPTIDYDMEKPIEVSIKEETKDQEDDVSTSTKEELNKSEKERKLKGQQDGLDKRRRDAMMRRGASSRSTPLTEAQKRAEKMRAYKVDLQKAKKANEEEERKRLEALKIERQKRIAARSGTVQSPLATRQPRSSLPTKVSPSSFKGSKFSNTEPGSKSPLEKVSIRSTSIGSNDSQKASKTSKPNATSNMLTKSASSLSELKKESNGVTTEAKTAVARTKRLSDPSVRNVQPVSQEAGLTNQMPKKNIANGPQMKKITEIVQLDKTKSAALPELKIRTPKSTPDATQPKLVQKEKSTQASTSIPEDKINEKVPSISSSDDNPVIEKTVVMLEKEMVSAPTVQLSAKEEAGPDSNFAAMRAPSPLIVEQAVVPSQHKPDEQLCCYEVVNDLPKNGTQNFSKTVTENFYQAPYARVSSMEDPEASNGEYTRIPSVQEEAAPIHTESVMARVSNYSNLIDQTNESDKPRKESKGFRKLLKFGRKSHNSASGDGNVDSDGSVADDQIEAGSSNDVHILKNLISQDDSHAGSTPPRAHRPFSILSPFRSSKSSEKKQTA